MKAVNASTEILRAIEDEVRDWTEAIQREIKSEKRQAVALAALDEWRQGEIRRRANG